jgi:hypothetical protein
MTKTSVGSKAGTCRQTAWRHDDAVGGEKLTIWARCESDSGLFSRQKLTAKELWTISSIACGWTPAPVARIPQITSLRPGKP